MYPIFFGLLIDPIKQYNKKRFLLLGGAFWAETYTRISGLMNFWVRILVWPEMVVNYPGYHTFLGSSSARL